MKRPQSRPCRNKDAARRAAGKTLLNIFKRLDNLESAVKRHDEMLGKRRSGMDGIGFYAEGTFGVSE